MKVEVSVSINLPIVKKIIVDSKDLSNHGIIADWAEEEFLSDERVYQLYLDGYYDIDEVTSQVTKTRFNLKDTP